MDKYTLLDRYVSFFRRRGWTIMDQEHPGMYASCILLSPCGKMVAKFTYMGEKDWETRDGWPDYITMCATVRSPHAPKVYCARRLYGRWFLGITEKLMHLPAYSEDGFTHFTPKAHIHPAWYPAIREANLVARTAGCDQRMDSPNLDSVRASVRGFFRAICSNLSFPYDLHIHNIMARWQDGKIEIVFNDPLAGVKNSCYTGIWYDYSERE